MMKNFPLSTFFAVFLTLSPILKMRKVRDPHVTFPSHVFVVFKSLSVPNTLLHISLSLFPSLSLYLRGKIGEERERHDDDGEEKQMVDGEKATFERREEKRSECEETKRKG